MADREAPTNIDSERKFFFELIPTATTHPNALATSMGKSIAAAARALLSLTIRALSGTENSSTKSGKPSSRVVATPDA